MTFLRFLMLLSLIVWLGGLIFFPVVAQTPSRVLPTRHLAGLVVRGSLATLHWMGIISGIVFLVQFADLSTALSTGTARSHWPDAMFLIVIMLLLTRSRNSASFRAWTPSAPRLEKSHPCRRQSRPRAIRLPARLVHALRRNGLPARPGSASDATGHAASNPSRQ